MLETFIFKGLYAFQQSDIIVVPGLMLSFIIFTKVSAVLFSTHLKKQSSFLDQSLLRPRHHQPSYLYDIYACQTCFHQSQQYGQLHLFAFNHFLICSHILLCKNTSQQLFCLKYQVHVTYDKILLKTYTPRNM